MQRKNSQTPDNLLRNSSICRAEKHSCLTAVESVDPEKECVFPFTFNNFTYNGCPSDPLDNTKRWCSTKSDGIHTSDSNNWGYCTSGCNPEVFPGIYFCQI